VASQSWQPRNSCSISSSNEPKKCFYMSWFSNLFKSKPAPAPALPPAPDYAKISRENLLAQIQLAPQIFAAESSPLYGQAAYANLQNQIDDILASGQIEQLAKYYPQIAQIESDYLNATRANEIAQLQSPEVGLAATQRAFNQLTPGYAEAAQGMGDFAAQQARLALEQPGYTAYEQQVSGPSYGQYLSQIQGPTADLTLGGMQAYRPGQVLGGLGEYQVGQSFLAQPAFQAGQFAGQVGGPQLQSQLGGIDQGLVQSYINQMPGVQDLAQQLTEQASEELAAGRELTPEEIRQATQSAREAYAARGTALGPQAITAEILARSELGDQRLRERQAAAAQAAQLSSQLYTPALQQAFQRQMGAEQYGLGAQQQAFGQAMSQEDLARAAQSQAFAQEGAKEQALAGAQAQAFTQRMGGEELGRAAQGQEFQQRAGLQELGLGVQSQAYQQAMGREGLAAETQNRAVQQALQRTQQDLAARQALQGLQAGRAQMGAAAMGALQQVQAPILQAYYRQPILAGAVPQAQQFALQGQTLAGPALFNPESQMGFQSAWTPYQAQVAQNIGTMQANASSGAGRSGLLGSLGSGLFGFAGSLFKR
jgi:hypothetical protein